MYTVVFSRTAANKLKKIDRLQAYRLLKRLQKLSDEMPGAVLEPLKGDLKGSYKLRVGDYRVIFQVDWEQQRIVVENIDHRSRIYKRR